MHMEQSLADAGVAQQFPHVATRRATIAAAAAPRYNIYATPHKALRLALSNALAAAGRVDPHDDAEVAALAEQVRGLLKFCATHLQKEEQFLHPAMEAVRPGSPASTQDSHLDHIDAMERLESQAQAIEKTKGALRETAVEQLYRHLASFLADNLVHMQEEETENNAVLWAAYGDDELHAIEQRLVASIPQDVKQLALRWIVPAMNPAERASFLREMRAHVPAAAFAAMLAGVQPALTEAEQRKLNHALAH
jgi:iron-sulfur cluster repair protein YtfE (RIC family)